MHSVSFNSKS